MRRICALVLSVSLLLAIILPCAAFAEEERVVLTIGEKTRRNNPRMSGEDQLAIWKYLDDHGMVQQAVPRRERERFLRHGPVYPDRRAV